MEKSKNHAFLATEKLGILISKYSIPCIISLLVGALYNIVDQIFIANADYLGSCGNAANTVVFPLTVIALAIAVMIGDGCCAFVSLNLGKNNVDDAKRSMGNMVREIVFGVGFALILPIFFGLDGVLYSMPVSDILTAVISAIIIAITYKQLS